MAKFMLIPVSAEDAEEAGISGDAAIESFVNEKGEIVIRALSDIDDYVCDLKCGECPVGHERCGNIQRLRPYVCRGRTIDPMKGMVKG